MRRTTNSRLVIETALVKEGNAEVTLGWTHKSLTTSAGYLILRTMVIFEKEIDMSTVYYVFKPCVGLLLLVLFLGCTHGINITGEGDVISATGDRDCELNDAPCSFQIGGAYQETYTATPRPGWVFDSWDVCGQANDNVCRFSVPANVVEQYNGLTMPFTVAHFRRPIQPLFADNGDGTRNLPNTPAANEFAWIVEQLSNSTTSIADINTHFHPDALSAVSATEWQNFFQTLRSSVPNAQIIDMVTVTPNMVRAIIGDSNDPARGFFVTVNTSYPESLITGWSAQAFPQNGTQTLPVDAALNYEDVSEKFSSMAQNTSLLVAKIESNVCRARLDHNSRVPQPTGSIFKVWVLGALANAIDNGSISANARLPFLASEVVPAGSTINNISPGTQIPLSDMAALMMGRSDNTATDHLHELVGRTAIESILRPFNNRNRSGLTPFLSVNEQFQIFWGLTPTQANQYASANDADQRQILDDVIVPLGPVTTFLNNNENALRTSSWQASALDVCSAIAGLRRFDKQSDAFAIVDLAYGAEAVLTTVRNKWDRVWSKGGSLANANGNYVLTLSWLFESDDRGAYAVVFMANNEDGSAIELGPMFSLASRVAEILDETN